jgi:tetratricopeptide (TPR) repeat protein
MPGAGEAAFDRHSAYFARFLGGREAELMGARRQAALAEIEADSGNVRVAWNRAATQGQIARIDQAVEALSLFYVFGHHYQDYEASFRLAAEKLAATGSADGQRIYARVLAGHGHISRFLGKSDLAGQLLSKSLSLLDSPALAGQDTRLEKAVASRHMGRLAADMGNPEKAERLFRQSLTLYQELKEEWRQAVILDELSALAQESGRFDEARRLADKSLAIRRTLGDPLGVAVSLGRLGKLAVGQGRLEKGERFIQESIQISRNAGNRVTTAIGLCDLVDLFIRSGKFAEADPLLQEVLAICDDLGLPVHTAYAHLLLSQLEIHRGQYEAARLNGQKSFSLAQEAGHRQLGISALEVLGLVALAEERYADAVRLYQDNLVAWMEQGDSLALAGLGWAARGLGHRAEANQHLVKALRTAAKNLNQDALKITLAMAALSLADRGEQERAVELYALAARYPFVANSRWFEDVIGRHMAAVAAALPPDVVAAAQLRAQTRDLEGTVMELLAEFEDLRV